MIRLFLWFQLALQPSCISGKLLLMFNKNSGDRTTFHHSKTTLLLLFALHTVLSDTCVQYSGTLCTQCAVGFQLVDGGCVSVTANNYTNNPILIFQDIPGVQKILYSVNPVVIVLPNNASLNSTQAPSNIVSQFQVVKVPNTTVGNFYEVHTNITTASKDVNQLLDNSYLLKQIAANSEINSSTSTSLTPAKLTNQIANSAQLNSTGNAQDPTSDNLTAAHQINQQSSSIAHNFTLISQKPASPQNLTLIKEASPLDLTPIKQTSSANADEPNLTPIKQTANLNISLTQAKQINSSLVEDANLTRVNGSNQTTQDSIISESNSNNTDLLLQLQQINQKLTQVGQTVSLTQAKMNQPSITIPVSLTQINQNQPSSNNGGAITLSLTQVGQQLTQINQQLSQARIKSSTNTSQASNSLAASDITPIPATASSGININTNPNLSKIAFNISQYSIPPLVGQSQISQEPTFTAAKQLIDINWIQATRYQLINLTLVSQALTQAKLKQSTQITSNTSASGTIYTFKCSATLTLFIPPTPSPKSPPMQASYAQYVAEISSTIAKQLQQYTKADRSTLCIDPPFYKSIKHLGELHPSTINLPLFAVYYQYCGFAKTFRVFFIDDSSLPTINILEGEIVVDLFRMMPTEVFFSNYNSTVLQPLI